MPHQPYYLADGTLADSVTTIIGDTLGWKQFGLNWFYYNEGKCGRPFKAKLKKAAELGTLAHAAVEAYERNEKIPKELIDSAEVSGLIIIDKAVEQWKDIKKQYNISIDAVEEALVSEKYRYGGCNDMRGSVNGVKTLIDTKTSKNIYGDHIIQISAYDNLLRENGIDVDGHAFLHIDKVISEDMDNIVHYIPVPSAVCDNGKTIIQNSFEVFKHCLGIYNMKKYVKIK